jgi:secondary thiamine-phosphate synthase enzyme
MIKRVLTLVAAMHITASVFISDDAGQRPVAQPHRRGRLSRTDRTADAHLKRQIMGREVIVAVTNGRLDFGTWERIFYGEFDGQRRKRVLVKIIGE